MHGLTRNSWGRETDELTFGIRIEHRWMHTKALIFGLNVFCACDGFSDFETFCQQRSWKGQNFLGFFASQNCIFIWMLVRMLVLLGINVRAMDSVVLSTYDAVDIDP